MYIVGRQKALERDFVFSDFQIARMRWQQHAESSRFADFTRYSDILYCLILYASSRIHDEIESARTKFRHHYSEIKYHQSATS